MKSLAQFVMFAAIVLSAYGGLRYLVQNPTQHRYVEEMETLREKLAPVRLIDVGWLDSRIIIATENDYA